MRNFYDKVILSYPKSILFFLLLCVTALGFQAQHLEIDASAEIKGKDDFSVRAGDFEYEENPFNRRIQKTFGEPEGIHGSVGIDQSKYRDDTYVGGKLVFPLGKPKN